MKTEMVRCPENRIRHRSEADAKKWIANLKVSPRYDPSQPAPIPYRCPSCPYWHCAKPATILKTLLNPAKLM